MKYSNESIKKHPWLWKFDERRKAQCWKIGHRFHWFRYLKKKVFYYVGLCKRCEKSSLFQIGKYDLEFRVQKEIVKMRTRELTLDEMRELMRGMDIHLPISHPLHSLTSESTAVPQGQQQGKLNGNS